MIVVPTPDPLLTTAQVAKVLGISSKTLVRYEAKGWVKPARVLPSGHRRWSLDEVRRQLDELNQRDDE